MMTIVSIGEFREEYRKKPSSPLEDMKTSKWSLKYLENSRSFSAPEVNASTLNQTTEWMQASEEKK